MQLTDFEQKSLKKLQIAMEQGKLTNAGLVQIIEQAGSFLNLRTRSDYQKDEGCSYNTAKKYRQNIKLFNVTFVIDNK